MTLTDQFSSLYFPYPPEMNGNMALRGHVCSSLSEKLATVCVLYKSVFLPGAKRLNPVFPQTDVHLRVLHRAASQMHLLSVWGNVPGFSLSGSPQHTCSSPEHPPPLPQH